MIIDNRLWSRSSQVQAAGHTGVLYPELIAPWEVQLLRSIVPWLLHLPVIKEIIRIPTDKKMALDSTLLKVSEGNYICEADKKRI